MDQFSNIEFNKWKAAKPKGYTYTMRCREHTQGVVTEIRCVDCDIMKPADDFSNANRKATGNHRCRVCVEFTESDLAQTNPLPAPDGLRSVDEWDFSSRIKQDGDVTKSLESMTVDDNDTRSMASQSQTMRSLQYHESSVPTDRASTVGGSNSGSAQGFAYNAYAPDSRVQVRTQSIVAGSDRHRTTPSATVSAETATKRGGWAKVPGRKNELKVPSYLTGTKLGADPQGDAKQDGGYRQPRAYDSDESPDEC